MVDALDRLATGARESVMKALDALSDLSFVRLVVTARPDTELPAASRTFDLGPATDESIEAYLARRGIPEVPRTEVIKVAKGSWLVARLLADQLVDDPSGRVIGDPFRRLRRSAPALRGHEQRRYRTHPDAARRGGGRTGATADPALRRKRSAPWTRMVDAHRAMAEAIAKLAPVGSTRPDLEDSIYLYPFEREAEHLWALGGSDKAIRSLTQRVSPIPRDNFVRWQAWKERIVDRLGPDHPGTLQARNVIAYWTGRCGNPREALQLLTALLPDQERVLEPNHRGTLKTRNNIASLTGECGDARGAFQLFTAFLPDLRRVLGAKDEGTLTARSNLAVFTGKCGNAREAFQLLTALLPELEEVLGSDHRTTLLVRNNIAGFTEKPRRALRLFTELLPDQERVLGPDHADTAGTRKIIGTLRSKLDEPTRT